MYASIVFYQIVIMLILAGIGLVYQKVHPLSEHDVSVISRIIAMVLSSGLILSGGAQDYSGLTTANCIAAAIVGFATYLSLMVIGYLLGRVLTKDRGRRIIYSMLCAFGNVGFFGIPLVNAAYSPEAAVYMYFFIVPCNICSYTLGYMMLSSLKDGSVHLQPKRLINPGFLACVTVCVLFLLGLQLPPLLCQITQYLTTASTPMAMFVVGIALYNTNWKKALSDWHMLLFCVIRQVIVPLLGGLLLRQFIADPALLGISIIMLSLPVGNATILLSDTVGVSSAPGPEVVSLTTIASVVTIPMILAILL